MKFLFKGATAFNQPIGDWETSSVTNMDHMFLYASALSDSNKAAIHYGLRVTQIGQPIGLAMSGETPLDDSNFQTAVNLWFQWTRPNAIATYGHISDWNTSAVTNMAHAFEDRTTFNENINAWDVSNVTNMGPCLEMHELSIRILVIGIPLMLQIWDSCLLMLGYLIKR